MLHLLLRQRVNDRLPRLLSRDVRVAHKTGNLPGVVNDVGVLYGPTSTVAVVALISDTSNEAAASAAIARVGLVAHQYFEAQPTESGRPSIPPLPARGVPAVWREPKPTPEPTPEPTETPEPTPTPAPTPVPGTSTPPAQGVTPQSTNAPTPAPVTATAAATRTPTAAVTPTSRASRP
jgi:outer membrane biosynthesis protein TonB